MTMLGARQGKRVKMLPFAKTARRARGGARSLALRLSVRTEHLNENLAVGKLGCQLDSLRDIDLTEEGLSAQRDRTTTSMKCSYLLVWRKRLPVKPYDFTVNADSGETLLLHVGEQFRELAFSTHDHRRHYNGFGDFPLVGKR